MLNYYLLFDMIFIEKTSICLLVYVVDEMLKMMKNIMIIIQQQNLIKLSKMAMN